MPYLKGQATSITDLIDKIVTWVTDTTIHGADAWKVMRNDPWPRGTIFQAQGTQSQDKIYIGLMQLDLKVNKSYSDWLLTEKNIGKYIMWTPKGLGNMGQSFTLYGGTIAVKLNALDPASDTVTYTFDSGVDIVSKDSRALVFGVFKQYSDVLDWNEQPGAIEFGDIGLMPITMKSNRNNFQTFIQPPIYPGVGYPGFGMDYNEPQSGFFSFWLMKDASHITVVIKNGENWDMGHAGLLLPYQSKMQYPFPAVMAGSCTGLVTSGKVLDPRYNTVSTGAKVDYTYSNWSLSRGMPPFAASPVDSSEAASQVCLCLPDGRWQYFSNWVQGINSAQDTNRVVYFTIPEPIRPKAVKHYIKPTCTDLGDLTTIYPTDDMYQMEPLDLIQDTSEAKNIFGRLWRMAWVSREVYSYGEATINGKKCLKLPNCWQNRPWYIPNGKTGLTDMTELWTQYQRIEANSRSMNCVIRLEDD